MDKDTAAQSASVLRLPAQSRESPAAARAIYRASEHMPAYAVEHRDDGVWIIPATDIDGAIGIPDDEGVPLATWLADGAKGAVLYRRPELVAARGEERSRYVYLVGTEITADRLRLEGAVATTCAGGLMAWRGTYARQLTGRHVVLVVTARGATSDRVAESLTPHAASVSVLEMAQTGEQFFASGRSVADLDALVLRAHRVSDAGDWATPVSLAETPVPTFPVEVLPGWLRDMVEDVAHATQVPPCFPAAHVLGALSTAAAGQVEVRLPTGYQMPLALWVMLVAEPGTRKSSVHSYATAPLVELSDRLAELTAQTRREAKAARISAEQALKQAEQQLRAADGEQEKTAAKKVYVEALAAVEAAVVPARPKLTGTDATPEAVARSLWQQGGRYAISSSEANVLQHMVGLYGRTPNIDVYLQGYSGDPVAVDRGGMGGASIGGEEGPERAVRRPALTINVSAQPAVLAGIDRADTIVGRGALDRFIIVVPDDPVGAREVWADSRIDAALSRYADQLVTLGVALHQAISERLPTGEPVSRPALHLSPAAASAIRAWLEDKEMRLAPKGDLRPLRGWVAKADGFVLRIAALLHLAQRPTSPFDSHAISEETARAAIAIVDYLIPHAQRAWRASSDGVLLDDARHIVAWLERTGKRRFDRREAYTAMRRFKERGADSIDAPLSRLVELGWLREHEVDGRVNRGFTVNPAVHAGGEAGNDPSPEDT